MESTFSPFRTNFFRRSKTVMSGYRTDLAPSNIRSTNEYRSVIRKQSSRMRRIHLFEVEDWAWFPVSLRDCLTEMLVVVHRMLGTADDLIPLIQRSLQHSPEHKIVDLCSGGGGPMCRVVDRLREGEGFADLELELTDLFPNTAAATELPPGTTYYPRSVDATDIPAELNGVRTMICSFHHMRPDAARGILENAQYSRQPICIYEISDNSMPPPWLFWVVLPINFVFALIVSLQVRPLHWRQLVFTWLLPILPICFAWDGAVSNVRTYSLGDMDELLVGLESSDYEWESGAIDGKLGRKLYLLGMPCEPT